MRWLVGIPFLLATLALAAGAISGRVRARSCCAVADPSKDLRMTPGPRSGPDVSAGA